MARTSPIAENSPHLQGAAVRPSGQAKILLVADDPATVDFLSSLLRGEGYQVVVARTGQQALDRILREPPSVVLLDLMLPDFDGLAVCRRIKNNPITTNLPVVLMTGPDADSRARAAEAGADDLIGKPPDRQELLLRVRSLAQTDHLHAELEASRQELAFLKEEQTRRLDEATRELQKLLKDKAHLGAGVGTGRSSADTEVSRPLPPAVEGPISASDVQALRQFKHDLMSRLSDTLEVRADLSRTPEMTSLLSQRLASLYNASNLRLPDEARRRLFREILDDILGYGPIEPLLADPTVTEVMVNGPKTIYYERKGRLSKAEIEFDDDDHVMRVINRIIRPLGRRVDRNSPMVDARLPDGSRVNVVIPPCVLDGPVITIRRFGERLLMADLIANGALTTEMATFLEACVRSRVSIIVSGGTGSGKTTFLNALSSYIPPDERIVTIEDSAELHLHQDHVVRMESKPPDVDGSGEVPIRQLVRNALRMRPNRIVVGEVRGGEALDMLQAMNTGHAGSLTTIHSNSPRDSIARLETLVLLSGIDLPLKAIRGQISSAIELIVHTARLRDGSRKVVAVTEVQGMEGEIVVLSDIFLFKEQPAEGGRVTGYLAPTGMRPKFEPKLEATGMRLSPTIYSPRPVQAQDRNPKRG